jgi:hypothetical protein
MLLLYLTVQADEDGWPTTKADEYLTGRCANARA